MSGSLIIRPETPEDYPAIAEVNRLAFGQDNEAQLVEAIRASDRFVLGLSLVAEQAGAIVGHVLLSQVDLVGDRTRAILCLAPLAVHPTHQNRGIGSALVEAGLVAAEASGAPLVVVLGHPKFYPRFGFEPSASYGIQQPFTVSPGASMVKRLSHYQPDYQGTIAYPASFAGV